MSLYPKSEVVLNATAEASFSQNFEKNYTALEIDLTEQGVNMSEALLGKLSQNFNAESREAEVWFNQKLQMNAGTILAENWKSSFMFDSRVIGVNKESVAVECLMDKDNKVFQTRSFPRSLFDHFSNLEIGKFIWVKILSKPGSSRVDIIDAKDVIDKTPFELEKGWDEIKPDFGNPISFK